MIKCLVAAVLLLVVSSLLFMGCAKEKPTADLSLQMVLAKKVLVLGLDDAFPPM